MKQLSFDDIAALRQELCEALRQLCPPDRIDNPELWEFIPEYRTPADVPPASLTFTVHVMRAEIEMRKRWGDRVYFALRSAAAKSEAYFSALVGVDETVEQLGEDTPMAWAYFDAKVFKRALGASVPESARNWILHPSAGADIAAGEDGGQDGG